MKKLLAISLQLSVLSAWAFDHTHNEWNVILKKYLVTTKHTSNVKYKELKESPEKLDRYLTSLSNVNKEDFGKWNKAQRLSFLINAYNAFTWKHIINHYPVDSIKDIGSLFSSAWKKKFIKIFGEKQHLDYLEHTLIRENFDEPEIHFALVCAAKGCPPLLEIAYNEKNLRSNFAEAAKRFLTDSSKNNYDSEKNQLNISPIFKWYGDDFEKKHGSFENYLMKFYKIAPKKAPKIKYLDYDWDLNEHKAM